MFRVLRRYRKEPNPPPDIRGGIQSMIIKEMNYFHYIVYQYRVDSVMGPWTLKTRSIPNDLSSLQRASLRHRYHLILGALVLAIGTRFLRGQLKRRGELVQAHGLRGLGPSWRRKHGGISYIMGAEKGQHQHYNPFLFLPFCPPCACGMVPITLRVGLPPQSSLGTP